MKKPTLSKVFKFGVTLSIFSLIYKVHGLNRKFKYIPNIPEDDSVIVINGKGCKPSIKAGDLLNLTIWNSYKAKKKGFFNDLRDLSNTSDIILLQEYYPTEEFLDNLKLNDNSEAISAISFYNRHEIPTGVCTLSNIEHSKVNFIRSEYREPILKTPKMALISEYKIEDREDILTIINVHGINFVSKHKFETQMNQILEIIKDINGPVVIGGDFNLWSKKRESVIRNSILLNDFKEVTFSNDIRRIKLDRIYIKNIMIIYSEVLKDIKSSDHKPLHIKFSIK